MRLECQGEVVVADGGAVGLEVVNRMRRTGSPDAQVRREALDSQVNPAHPANTGCRS